MCSPTVPELLRGNTYPGRGIVLGCSADGKRSIVVYFIMGRSQNSRNRVFEKTPDGFRTRAYDPVKLTDPSLVIYNALRVFNGQIIVTNGVQTDTIREYLENGNGFRDALHNWEFEPDPPIYTPRISGLINRDGSYLLSILKCAGGDPSCCIRCFYEYSHPLPGIGHFISTYISDGASPPSFTGEPVTVSIPDTAGSDNYAAAVWDALNDENKVSLYVRETIISTGESKECIINKYA